MILNREENGMSGSATESNATDGGLLCSILIIFQRGEEMNKEVNGIEMIIPRVTYCLQ
jgi:hypothetical protein